MCPLQGRDESIRLDLETLELSHDATELEIRAAYRRLKELYSKGSIAMSPLDEEFTPERKREILDRIEESYARLSSWLDKTREAAVAAASEGAVSGSHKNGAALRRVREVLGLSAHDIERKIKVGARHITNIEEENYAKLPEPVYVHGYVVNYARCLGLDPQRTAKEYMESYRAWQESLKKKR